MIKKILFLGFFILTIIYFIPAVNAQTSTGAAREKQIQILQDQKRTEVSQIREQTKAIIQAKRDEFKTKLQTIKDQRKKVLVEKIDIKIAEVNKNQTDRFSELLNKLQAILDKINQSADTNVLADITAAQLAIDTAKSAVEAQAAKMYTMIITDDAALKLNAGTSISQLRLDLMASYKLVIDAKQTVMKLMTDKTTTRKEAVN